MMFEYSGAIHMHSTYSDGTGTVPDIMRYANETNLDFAILTDHNTMGARDDGFEKWYNDSMLIVGYEMNDLQNKNHYLTFGLDKVIGSYEKLDDGELGSILTAEEYVKKINDEGGFGFTAHPDEKRNWLPDHPSYPWQAWDAEFTGIEIWNHMSEWIEGMNEKNKLQRFLHPLRSIIAPPESTLQKWDELNTKRKVVGIGGIDAHAHKQNIMGFYEVEIFPYKVLFKSIRTNVLLETEIKKNNSQTFHHDKLKILNALKNGNSFIVNTYHGSGKGFRFFADYNGKSYIMGDEIIYDNPDKKIILRALIPEKAKVRLIKDGVCIDEFESMECIWDSDEKGSYRIECWKNDKGWIFSNHIRVL